MFTLIRLFVFTFKFAVLAVIILLIGLVPVEEKRISEHVLEFTKSETVQGPIEWITKKVDFTEGHTEGFFGKGKIPRFFKEKTRDLPAISRKHKPVLEDISAVLKD